MRYRRLPNIRPTPRDLHEPIYPRKKRAIWTRWRPVPVKNVNFSRVTYGPEGLDDYLGSTLTYSQVPPRANAAVKVVTVLTNVNASEFRKELAFRFRKNAMRYFTKH